MSKIVLLAIYLLLVAVPSLAQGTYQFLGPPREVPDLLTEQFRIQYNTQGYDDPLEHRVKKMRKRGAPDWAIQEVLNFPGSRDAIGRWIDDAFLRVREQFLACGGSIAHRASRVDGSRLRVLIMPSAFYEPYWGVLAAGVYYPSKREIRVLNIYYTWEGPNRGWLRHARDLIRWEMGNFFAIEVGIQPEPRSEGWPCTAPPLR
jgi:hypothetical protein